MPGLIAIAGPIRLERSYDARFATSELDPGMPVWELHLDAISAQVADDSTPDGSLVQLEGEIDANAWFVVKLAREDPFAPSPERLWRDVLRRQRGETAMFALFPDDASTN